jgi:hypothetical protein
VAVEIFIFVWTMKVIEMAVIGLLLAMTLRMGNCNYPVFTYFHYTIYPGSKSSVAIAYCVSISITYGHLLIISIIIWVDE